MNTIPKEIQDKHIPTDITYDTESQVHTASYDYYTGIKLMKLLGRTNTGVSTSNTYMVCCGDVMTTITKEDYPNMLRRNI